MDVIGIVQRGSLVWRSPSSVTKEPGHDDNKGTVENYERKGHASHRGHTGEGGKEVRELAVEAGVLRPGFLLLS